jgi:hypothetical protein
LRFVSWCLLVVRTRTFAFRLLRGRLRTLAFVFVLTMMMDAVDFLGFGSPGFATSVRPV